MIYTVNEQGLAEIKEILAINHRLGGDHFNRDMLYAWAADAEFQLEIGNPPSIEIPSGDSVRGHTQTFTLSREGFDAADVDEDE